MPVYAAFISMFAMLRASNASFTVCMTLDLPTPPSLYSILWSGVGFLPASVSSRCHTIMSYAHHWSTFSLSGSAEMLASETILDISGVTHAPLCRVLVIVSCETDPWSSWVCKSCLVCVSCHSTFSLISFYHNWSFWRSSSIAFFVLHSSKPQLFVQ